MRLARSLTAMLPVTLGSLFATCCAWTLGPGAALAHDPDGGSSAEDGGAADSNAGVIAAVSSSRSDDPEITLANAIARAIDAWIHARVDGDSESPPEGPGSPSSRMCASPDDLLLPDIVIDVQSLQDHHLSTDCDGLPGVSLCLRVSVGTVNMGEGDLVLTAPVGHQDQISEHIDTCGGGEQLAPVASAFVDEPSHQHLHLRDWTELRLRKIDDSCADDATAMNCPVAGLGHKISFCLTDTGRYDGVLGRDGGQMYCGVDQGGTRIIQGISSGWMDVYGSGLPGQLIDVSGLTSGDYWLEVEVNPRRAVTEASYTNNITRIRTQLVMPSCGDGVLSIGEDCDASATPAPIECTSLGRGFGGGQASCNAQCKIETTQCTAVVCPQHDLGSAIGPAVATGASPSGPNSFSGVQCGFTAEQTGPELTYSWTAPRTATFGFDTVGSTYDTVAYLLGPSCEALPNIRTACNDDIEGSNASRVSLRMQAGESVVIVVDSYAPGISGSFVLNVNEVPDPLAPSPAVATHPPG